MSWILSFNHETVPDSHISSNLNDRWNIEVWLASMKRVSTHVATVGMKHRYVTEEGKEGGVRTWSLAGNFSQHTCTSSDTRLSEKGADSSFLAFRKEERALLQNQTWKESVSFQGINPAPSRLSLLLPLIYLLLQLLGESCTAGNLKTGVAIRSKRGDLLLC